MQNAKTILFASVALAVFLASQVHAKVERGLAWAADNQWAKSVAKGDIMWYHHWENGKVDTIPDNIEYVPTYWGPQKASQWGQVKASMGGKMPKNLLAFNEPDVQGQANMSPQQAVSEFMKELQPFAEKGVNVSTPQMVYNLDWLDQFMNGCKKAGCKISFAALHWYGSTSDLPKFKKWVSTVNKRYNIPVWVTEFGITQQSHPSQGQVIKFLNQAMDFLSDQKFVHRAAWNGAYCIENPPDQYATRLNAMFNTGGALRPIAQQWIWNGFQHKRSQNGSGHEGHAFARRHKVARSNDAEEIDNEGDAVMCDEYCQQREKYMN